MAYDEKLAERIRNILKTGYDEKKMFGGLCFLAKGKMLCGVLDKKLVVRCDPADQPALVKQKGVRPMDFTGKPMRGFLYVEGSAIAKDADVKKWIARSRAWVAAQK